MKLFDIKIASLARKALATAVLTTALVGSAQAQGVSVKISMDSNYILMGKQTGLLVETTEPASQEGGMLLLPADTLSREVEIASIGMPDSSMEKGTSNNLYIKQTITIQSFDSGLYQIGPLLYLTGKGDTVRSNALSLKVIPVDVDSLQTIHPFADVSEGDSRWWDFMPDFILDYIFWWCLLGALILFAIGSLIFYKQYKKKGRLPFLPKAKPVPPYQLAVSELEQLRDRHLCENGEFKQYYTELTDILRKYLEGRFGINAMEMTSTQILAELEREPEISRHQDLMRRILDTADFVKFANSRPMPDDNVRAWQNARDFVEDTKPQPEPDTKEEKK